jgi:hypothetical protein
LEQKYYEERINLNSTRIIELESSMSERESYLDNLKKNTNIPSVGAVIDMVISENINYQASINFYNKAIDNETNICDTFKDRLKKVRFFYLLESNILCFIYY